MTEKPEALRLAAELSKSHLNHHVNHAAAAELRRLHTENERLHQINQSHEMKLSVRGYEIQIADLEAQRDALLGLLKEARKIIRATSSRNLVKDWDQRTTAAIKAVEEEA